jgi:hypothetical protein
MRLIAAQEVPQRAGRPPAGRVGALSSSCLTLWTMMELHTCLCLH